MTLNNTYFFDSYAIIETILGNPNFNLYVDSKIITTKENLFEVCYWILKNMGEKELDEFLNEYYNYSIDVFQSTIKEASLFKLMHKKKRLSMADCLGYILARQLGIKFLTGDKEFNDFPNVEFVK